jgi:hypothetical protein
VKFVTFNVKNVRIRVQFVLVVKVIGYWKMTLVFVKRVILMILALLIVKNVIFLVKIVMGKVVCNVKKIELFQVLILLFVFVKNNSLNS